MTLNRRMLLLGGVAAAGTAGFAGYGLMAQSNASFNVPLPIPPMVDPATRGGMFDLIIQQGKSRIVPSGDTATYGYSGAVLGPIIRVRSGQSVTANVVNRLPMASSVHWHGLFIPSDVDGPFNLIEPGRSWSPTLRVNQRAATTWFHPHPHGDTARQTYMGLAGLLYVEDGSAEAFDLPREHGIDDLPIILQDRSFASDGQLLYDRSPMAMMHGSRGNTVIVNGAIRPVAKPPAGLVRLRLLDGANARNFRLAFSDDRTFHVIANDAGWLAEPVPLKEIEISPGERYEILVDFTDGKPAELLTTPDHNGRFGDSITERAKQLVAKMRERREAVLRFEPQPAPNRAKHALPKVLAAPERAEPSRAVRRRKWTLDSMMAANMPMMRASGGTMNHGGQARQTSAGGAMSGMAGMANGMKMGINGQVYDVNRIDADVTLGSQEIWEIVSTEMAHPFHIHGATFRILTKADKPVAAHEAGIKDTVLVETKAELLVSFNQRSTRDKPFVFHCHVLEHEELGMMGSFLAQSST